MDYEVELGVVIGKDAKMSLWIGHWITFSGIPVPTMSRPTTCKNCGGRQWVKSKSFDTFCPMGPFLVTADEIGDPQHLTLTCRLNGEVMQGGSRRI